MRVTFRREYNNAHYTPTGGDAGSVDEDAKRELGSGPPTAAGSVDAHGLSTSDIKPGTLLLKTGDLPALMTLQLQGNTHARTRSFTPMRKCVHAARTNA